MVFASELHCSASGETIPRAKSSVELALNNGNSTDKSGENRPAERQASPRGLSGGILTYLVIAASPGRSDLVQGFGAAMQNFRNSTALLSALVLMSVALPARATDVSLISTPSPPNDVTYRFETNATVTSISYFASYYWFIGYPNVDWPNFALTDRAYVSAACFSEGYCEAAGADIADYAFVSFSQVGAQVIVHEQNTAPADFYKCDTPGATPYGALCGFVSLGRGFDVSGTVDGPLEITNLTVTYGPAPEPATWALMLAGFGLAGAALRRRHKLQSA